MSSRSLRRQDDDEDAAVPARKPIRIPSKATNHKTSSRAQYLQDSNESWNSIRMDGSIASSSSHISLRDLDLEQQAAAAVQSTEDEDAVTTSVVPRSMGIRASSARAGDQKQQQQQQHRSMGTRASSARAAAAPIKKPGALMAAAETVAAARHSKGKESSWRRVDDPSNRDNHDNQNNQNHNTSFNNNNRPKRANTTTTAATRTSSSSTTTETATTSATRNYQPHTAPLQETAPPPTKRISNQNTAPIAKEIEQAAQRESSSVERRSAATETVEPERQRRRPYCAFSTKCWILIVLNGCVLIAAAVVAVVFALRGGFQNNDDDNNNNNIYPTMAPTESSSYQGTISTDRFQEFVDLMGNQISHDIQVFQDPTSVQYQALSWLANVDVWNKGINIPIQIWMERYALGVLYFATSSKQLQRQLQFLSPNSVCSWADQVDDYLGVQCNERFHVTHLNLCECRESCLCFSKKKC